MASTKTNKKVVLFKDLQTPVFDKLAEGDQAQILRVQTEIEHRLLNVKADLFEIGKLLSKAKAIIPHGMFQQWVEETWGKELPYTTAACFKAIYEEFKDNQETVKMLPVTFLIQLKQKDFPEEIRKLIMENPEAFNKDDLAIVQEAYKAFKENKIDLNHFETTAREQIKIGRELYVGHDLTRKALLTKRTIRSGIFKLKNATSRVRKYSNQIRQFFPPSEVLDKSFNAQYLYYLHPKGIGYHNRVVTLMKQTLDDDLIKEIDGAIKELESLKKDIEGTRGLFKDRLVSEKGIIKKKMISNL